MAFSFQGLLAQLFQLYLFILMIRFALHLARADFCNPLVQFIIKATDWLVAPLQKLLRPGRHFDPATLLAATLFGAITTAILHGYAQATMPAARFVFTSSYAAIGLAGAGLLGAVYTLLQIYFLALIGLVIMSWIAPRPTHPAPLLILDITRPILAPVQRILPPIGGMIDLSPMVVFFIIMLIKGLVLIPLANNVLLGFFYVIPQLIVGIK